MNRAGTCDRTAEEIVTMAIADDTHKRDIRKDLLLSLFPSEPPTREEFQKHFMDAIAAVRRAQNTDVLGKDEAGDLIQFLATVYASSFIELEFGERLSRAALLALGKHIPFDRRSNFLSRFFSRPTFGRV